MVRTSLAELKLQLISHARTYTCTQILVCGILGCLWI